MTSGMVSPWAADVVRVLLVDDHVLSRRRIRGVLSTVSGAEIVGEAADGNAAVVLAEELEPDLVLINLQGPAGGLAAVRALGRRSPGANILVLTEVEDDDAVLAVMRAGARGSVAVTADPDDLARAILTVGRGSALFPRGIADRMVRLFDKPSTRAALFPDLTGSERKVLQLLASGADNATIARRLSLSPKTVRNYVSEVVRKLGVPDRGHAIAVARGAGLAGPPPEH